MHNSSSNIVSIKPAQRAAGFAFWVVLQLDDGAELGLSLPAKAIVTYAAFRTACLDKAGIVFGDSCFERRGGATAWREELSRAMAAGQEAEAAA